MRIVESEGQGGEIGEEVDGGKEGKKGREVSKRE